MFLKDVLATKTRTENGHFKEKVSNNKFLKGYLKKREKIDKKRL